jgi:hypothetical protein
MRQRILIITVLDFQILYFPVNVSFFTRGSAGPLEEDLSNSSPGRHLRHFGGRGGPVVSSRPSSSSFTFQTQATNHFGNQPGKPIFNQPSGLLGKQPGSQSSSLQVSQPNNIKGKQAGGPSGSQPSSLQQGTTSQKTAASKDLGG